MRKLIIPVLIALIAGLSLGGCTGGETGTHEGMAAFDIDENGVIVALAPEGNGAPNGTLCTYNGEDADGDSVELRGGTAGSTPKAGVWIITKCTHKSASHFGF